MLIIPTDKYTALYLLQYNILFFFYPKGIKQERQTSVNILTVLFCLNYYYMT